MLEYKGYHAEIIHNKEENYYSGRLYGIHDLVTFGGETNEKVEADFHDAVEDYLEFCAELNQEPNREDDGIFKVNYNLYQTVKDAAKKAGENYNTFVEKILADYFAKTAESGGAQ